MDLDRLSEKLKRIQNDLKKETEKCKEFAKKLSEQTFDDPRDEKVAKDNYYDTLDHYEKIYQKKNDEYKELISGFSDAYLEMSSFYVGPELPREHEQTFLDDKESLNTLYFMFMMSLFLKV
jgi:hypothetical protein